MIKNLSKKSLKDCEIINYWAHSIPLMRLLKKDEDLYLDELFLLSHIFTVTNKLGRPAKQIEVTRGFNILSYKRDKMLLNLLKRGFIKNDMIGPSTKNKAFQYILSTTGEQLLIKYNKAMIKLING